jgi:hypothetical protein
MFCKGTDYGGTTLKMFLLPQQHALTLATLMMMMMVVIPDIVKTAPLSAMITGFIESSTPSTVIADLDIATGRVE